FARQTGMACTACHFQHFPLLNGFGRAFKAAGYTMMGAQDKVEGEHLSIPGQLNMTVLATAGVQHTNANAGTPNSQLFVPGSGGELQLFIGGKVTDFAGFLSEFGMSAPTASTANAKLHLMPEVAPGIHAGVTVFTGNQGASGSMEMLNTGASSVHRLMGNTGPNAEHMAAYSARQYMTGLSTAAAASNAALLALVPGAVAPTAAGQGGTGASVNVVADNFVVSLGKEAAANNVANAPGTLGALNYTYARGIFMTDIAGFDSGFGIQYFGGVGYNAVLGGNVARKMTVIDGQMQGALGGMPVGFYASYASAPAGNAAEYNAFNSTLSTTGLVGQRSANSFNIAGELGVVPGIATVQLALRNAKTGAGTNDNAIMIGATYELAMNMELSLHYTTQSGSAWTGLNGNNATTFLLETLF
ncbi:MAG TPA: hypothetical protein VFW53_09080, partial [Gallionella sp.]|nr:hypothetical protein [Gallionella sp.]